MAINAPDIKLLEAEIMADTTDGGGRRTSRIIPDGVAGNIFPKVSRLDSVYGRVNLRKVYGTVQTANVDTYAGAHAIITDAPDNAQISTTLFSTGSEFDIRSAARDRIESYVTSSSESRMTLVGRQLPGQQSILTYQRVEEPLPEIGEVYCLSNETGTVVTTQQYVRIGDLTHEVRTFTDEKGEFQRRVINIDIGVPLRYEFSGPDSPSRYSGPARASKVRETTVVDAARYFGIQPFAVAASHNALTVNVKSVYTPVVPTTNREIAISNENISDALSMVAATATPISTTLPAFSVGQTRYVHRGILPGSLTVSGTGVTTVTDDKLGNISNSTFIGIVDYETGSITRTGGTAYGYDFTGTYIPATTFMQPAHTRDIQVDLNNRGTVYTVTLNPLPSPQSIILDYRALGKWYRLRDNGAGVLAGTDDSYGVGQISYVNGALVVTLGALPDVDSSIIISWGSPSHCAVRSGATSDAATKMTQKITLPDLPINPNSVSLTYTANSVSYTATDDATGVLTGDGVTGKVNYTTGEVSLEYTIRLPDSNTNVAFAYEQITPTNPLIPTVQSLSTTSAATTNLADSITAGSLVGTLFFAGQANVFDFSGSLEVFDKGTGLLYVRANQALETTGRGTAIAKTETAIGTVNYSTGEIVVNSTVPVYVTSFNPLDNTWIFDHTEIVSVSYGPANWGWKSAGAAGGNTATTYYATFAVSPIKLDLTTTIADNIVPGSVMFSTGGKTFIDRNGTLYTDVSATTGSGTVAGSIDYSTGVASISYWTNGAALTLSVQSCLTQYGIPNSFLFYFRTPGSPIRPGSFYVQATTTKGALLSASANDNGYIVSSKINGTVDQEMGVVRLAFGQWVTAAGNESEWWYDAANIVGAQIFKPEPIQPNTLTFSCVVLSNLPLNADILGLDPVRLPMDGRVPIYHPADVVVIHNTDQTVLTNPVVADTTYAAGRTDLAEIWVVDQNGTKLTAGQYAYDLAAGTITLAADFTAGALVQPLIIKHRVEDMSLVTDVQINGQLTLASPLTRDYPLDSFVSSALLFGDMNGRVTNLFDLLSFSAWSDTPGTGATAQFNNIDYPVEVLNNGSVTERWRINFTSTTAFQVIGENLGVIATGTTAADCSPANQLTGQPYFVIRAGGWGAGWSAGNQLRFNTISAAAPIWIARTILPGATLEGDSFSMQMRGDVDAV